MNNSIKLYGKFDSYLSYASTDRKGNVYYSAKFATKRESGFKDIIPVIIEEDTEAYRSLVNDDREIMKRNILIHGEVRTRNQAEKGKDHNRLVISVRVIKIEDVENYDGKTNEVKIMGFLCKKLPIRTTPRGSRIVDMILAVPRGERKNVSDYIPTIAWHGTAERIDKKGKIGDCMKVVGRLQSREYDKIYENGDIEIRRCYELSISRYEKIEKKAKADSQQG